MLVCLSILCITAGNVMGEERVPVAPEECKIDNFMVDDSGKSSPDIIKNMKTSGELLTFLKCFIPSAHEVISDYYFTKSCGNKSVDDYPIEEILWFIRHDHKYHTLLSAKRVDAKGETYKDLLSTYHKVNCEYNGFFGIEHEK
jgi:hypothetical protein